MDSREHDDDNDSDIFDNWTIVEPEEAQEATILLGNDDKLEEPYKNNDEEITEDVQSNISEPIEEITANSTEEENAHESDDGVSVITDSNSDSEELQMHSISTPLSCASSYENLELPRNQSFNDLSDLSANQELPENWVEAGHKKYIHHQPNYKINLILNGMIVVFFAAVIGLGIGHFVGLQEECPLALTNGFTTLNSDTSKLLKQLEFENEKLRLQLLELEQNNDKIIKDIPDKKENEEKNNDDDNLYTPIISDNDVEMNCLLHPEDYERKNVWIEANILHKQAEDSIINPNSDNMQLNTEFILADQVATDNIPAKLDDIENPEVDSDVLVTLDEDIISNTKVANSVKGDEDSLPATKVADHVTINTASEDIEKIGSYKKDKHEKKRLDDSKYKYKNKKNKNYKIENDENYAAKDKYRKQKNDNNYKNDHEYKNKEKRHNNEKQKYPKDKSDKNKYKKYDNHNEKYDSKKYSENKNNKKKYNFFGNIEDELSKVINKVSIFSSNFVKTHNLQGRVENTINNLAVSINDIKTKVKSLSEVAAKQGKDTVEKMKKSLNKMIENVKINSENLMKNPPEASFSSKVMRGLNHIKDGFMKRWCKVKNNISDNKDKNKECMGKTFIRHENHKHYEYNSREKECKLHDEQCNVTDGRWLDRLSDNRANQRKHDRESEWLFERAKLRQEFRNEEEWNQYQHRRGKYRNRNNDFSNPHWHRQTV